MLIGKEGEILHLLADYSKTLKILEAYDNGEILDITGIKTDFVLTYENCKNIIRELKKELSGRKEAGDLFGNERGELFEGILKNIY